MTSILSEETKLRDEICEIGLSLFERGYTVGSTGNISARLSNGSILATPTNSSLGKLAPPSLSLLSAEGRQLSGDKPTKEAFLHRCMYCARPDDGAVIHLHSTYCVAVSTLDEVDAENVLPPLTAYYVMRVGSLPLIPYFPPGDQALAEAVGAGAKSSHAVLLANHGPVVSGKKLREAQYAIEELEETAKLYLLLRGQKTRPLSVEQVTGLKLRL
jgi:ribulose-5-phosphate 4-epimerase/fuculose-1-phosphate aldolase